MANTAPIKWAQRSDSLYITIALSDVSDQKIELTDTNLNFTGTSGGKDYEVHIDFFKNVKASVEESKYKVTPRSVQFYVLKEVDDEDFWPRLLKDKIKEKNQVKIDWDRYVDEDEEEDEGGFDLSGMEGGAGMGGMPGGGMGGMPGGMPGGMGGMPGGMGGMPGGMGGMDMEALMKQMQGMGGMPGGDEPVNDDVDGDSDDDLPDLEDV